jgi:peptide/nickel transport system substrate-binding protein
MRSGEIDGAFSLPIDQADQWAAIEGVTVKYAPELSIYFFSFDTEAEPWSDVHVRRAFAHALDKEGLLNALLKGHGQPAVSLPPPGQWGGVLPQDQVRELYATFPVYGFDLAKANEELAESLAPDGFAATVQYPDASPELGKIALSLSENLKQIGVQLTVTEVTSEKWLSDLYSHENLGIQAIQFLPDYPDPANYANLHASVQAVKNGPNLANYNNPTVDRLIGEQQSSADPAVRAKAMGEMLRIAAEELPYLPVLWPDTAMAIRDTYVYEGFNALYFNVPWATKVKPAA